MASVQVTRWRRYGKDRLYVKDADGHDLGMFEVGMELEVLVFDALDEQRKPAKLVGEIVRHDGDGLALMWADSDPDIAIRLVQLLDQLQPRTPKSE